MKRIYPNEKTGRFVGSVRHYHRTPAKTQRSWDAWIDEKSATEKAESRPINWLKILVILTAVLVLGGIIAGLVIELL